MAENVETIIVGGGQSGLAMSYWLTQAGHEHLVLERGRVVERWRSERWDSLCLLTPNWTVALPAYEYDGCDPDGFMGKDEIIEIFARYAERNRAPIRTGVTVTRVQQSDNGSDYSLETTAGSFVARNVVVATGPFGTTAVPAFGSMLPSHIFQVHSNAYRNPAQLPSGATLVVGSGASGFQIVEDLLAAGRQVYFSLGRHEARRRRYRGQDMAFWMTQIGQWERTVDQAPRGRYEPRSALTGVGGGHDLSVRKLAAEGATLLGRARGAEGGRLRLAADLADTVREGDGRSRRTHAMIDDLIVRKGLDAPPDMDRETWPDPKELADPIAELDLKAAGITSVVWATGFRYEFDWIQLPVFGAEGDPEHRRGVTACPGLYFLGLRWLYKFKSSFIHGVGEDAEFLAEQISARASQMAR